MRSPVSQGRFAGPGGVLFDQSAGCLARSVSIGKQRTGHGHHVGVSLEEANRVFEVGGMELHIVIEKRRVMHIERYLANGSIALRASAARSYEYGHSCRRAVRWSVLKRSDTQKNMSRRPGLSPDGLKRFPQNFGPIFCGNYDGCLNSFHPFCAPCTSLI